MLKWQGRSDSAFIYELLFTSYGFEMGICPATQNAIRMTK